MCGSSRTIDPASNHGNSVCSARVYIRKLVYAYLKDVTCLAAKLPVLKAGPVEKVIERVAILWTEHAVRDRTSITAHVLAYAVTPKKVPSRGTLQSHELRIAPLGA